MSDDPLVLPTKGTAQFRPDVETAIANLLLCGGYLNGEWEIANMELACCNGRRAANAVLARSGSRETPVAVLSPYRPPEWEPFCRADELRWRAGQPNVFDDHDAERVLA